MPTGASRGTPTRGPRWPDVTRLIPHRPPILMVEEIVGACDGEVVCRGILPSCSSVEGVAASPFLALELAAQTAAVMAALEGGQSPGHGSVGGYLAAIHDARFLVSAIPGRRPVLATVRRTRSMPPLTRYSVKVTLEDGSRDLVRATLSTYETPLVQPTG